MSSQIRSQDPDDIDAAPLATMARFVGVSAAVGLGLAAATLLFLWVTGFFKEAGPNASLEDFGQAIVGGIAIVIVSVFGLLVGIVLAGVAGVWIGMLSSDRRTAAVTGALAGALGHLALIAVLGVVLVVFVDMLSPEAAPAPTPPPVPTRSQEELADCRNLFGADSPACIDQTPLPTEPQQQQDSDSGIDFDDVFKLMLGFIPAAIVGALTAALLFPGYATEDREPDFFGQPAGLPDLLPPDDPEIDPLPSYLRRKEDDDEGDGPRFYEGPPSFRSPQ